MVRNSQENKENLSMIQIPEAKKEKLLKLSTQNFETCIQKKHHESQKINDKFRKAERNSKCRNRGQRGQDKESEIGYKKNSSFSETVK